MTSQWRHYCFGGLNLSRVPFQESVAMAKAKDLHSNFYLLTNSYIFSGKVTKFGWIIFLPFWDMGKKPQGWCWTPRQDRVKLVHFSKKSSVIAGPEILVFVGHFLVNFQPIFDCFYHTLSWSMRIEKILMQILGGT